MLGPCDKQDFKLFLDLVILVNVETTNFDQIFVRFLVRKSMIMPIFDTFLYGLSQA